MSIKALKEEAIDEAGRRYPNGGYGQSEFFNIVIELIAKRIDERIGQLEFFLERIDDVEYDFNVKRTQKMKTKDSLGSKKLAYLEMKDLLK